MTIAVLSRARGNRGELAAVSLSSEPERFERLERVYLFGDGRPFQVESVWFHDGELIWKFRGVDSISEAEALRGAEVRIPLAERRKPQEGEYFQSDLVGCQVVEQATGQVLGEVTKFEENGGSGLLVVGDGLLVPFVRSICLEIDTDRRRIVVELPDGLKELNRP